MNVSTSYRKWLTICESPSGASICFSEMLVFCCVKKRVFFHWIGSSKNRYLPKIYLKIKEALHLKCDVVIVGAGPAGIFTALELVRGNTRKKIVMVEKGNPVQKRHCPKNVTGRCVNCKPYCHITTGFSGAGAFSDGKLS